MAERETTPPAHNQWQLALAVFKEFMWHPLPSSRMVFNQETGKILIEPDIFDPLVTLDKVHR